METTTATKGIKNYSQADLGQNPSVNLATGRLRYSFADLSVGRGNLAVGISHVYVSDLPDVFQEKFPSLFWNKWKLNLSQCIMQEDSNYVYLDENGELHRFIKFDSTRYYDERNAKTVLTVNGSVCEIADGVGNKLYFNKDGLLYQSNSCRNVKIAKRYVYEDNKLVTVYDKRTLPSGSTTATSRIELAYDNNNRLSSMTSYADTSTQLLQLNYTYDTDGNLTNVEKEKVAKRPFIKKLFTFVYSKGYLTTINDCETNIDTKFEFTDGRVTKQSVGIDPNQKLSTAQVNAGSDIMPTKVVRPHLLPYKTLKFNSYSYNFLNSADNISVRTDVANEKGIRLAYFIDRNACITSSFEKVEELVDDVYIEALRTLTKQGAKRTGLITGSGEYINGNGSMVTTNGAISVTLPDGFDIARNNSEKEMERFEYSLWVKHNCSYPRMQLEFKYVINESSYRQIVQLQPAARNAWQRVNVPIYVPKGLTGKLKNLSIRFLFVNGQINDKFYVNEIGFSPAPYTRLRIPMSGGSYMNYAAIKSIIVNDAILTRENDIATYNYMTEEDIMATAANRFGKWYMLNGSQCFDIIYENNTRRKAGVYSLVFQNSSGQTASSVNSVPYQTYTQVNILNHTVITDYVHSSSTITINQTCNFTKDDNTTVTTNTTTVVDYKGNTVKETDEYGVSKNYTYDSFGNVKSVTVTDSAGNVGSSVYYNYDSDGCLINSHNGITGQQVSYNQYDQVSSVTEGKPLSGNNEVLQLTQHHVDNGYDVFQDSITQVAEYDGTTKYGTNTITYENGRVRTVSDGKAKYGVKYNVANQKVEYTQFDGDVEGTLQKDSVNIDSSTKAEAHTSEFATNDKISTTVDKYGRTQQVSKQTGDSTETYNYTYDEGIKESKFASKPKNVKQGDNIVTYNYDYDGNLAKVWFGEKIENSTNYRMLYSLHQIEENTTKYTYDKELTEYYASLQRDPNKMLDPRITSAKNMWYQAGNTAYEVKERPLFCQDYSYDNLGRIKYKSCKDTYTYEYDYASIGVSSPPLLKSVKYHNSPNLESGKVDLTQDETYVYYANGDVKSIVQDYSYDVRNLPSYELYKGAGNIKKEYVYDRTHRITQDTYTTTVDGTESKVTSKYKYTDDGRLSEINQQFSNKYSNGNTGEYNQKRVFTYDEFGRLQYLSYGNTSYYSFTYDAYGNRKSKSIVGNNVQYEYKFGNMLHKVNNNGVISEYEYNLDGVRSKKTVNGIETKYCVDGNKILREFGKNSLYYYYGKDGLIGFEVSNNDYRKQYGYVHDSQGNVTMIFNTALPMEYARYEYDVLGNCTVYDGNGEINTDPNFIGNINPFRWKSFYFDVETNLYYANGSYYDPKTGTYVDASPISTILDRAFTSFNLDRNAPICNNMLELAGNPSTIYTQTDLHTDPSYNPEDKLPDWLKRRYARQRRWAEILNWYNNLHWGWKLCIGLVFLFGAVGFTLSAGLGMLGVAKMLAQVAIGIGVGVAMWAAGTALAGGQLTWEGLGNAALDAFLASSAIAFISSGINYIQYLSRSTPATTAELAQNTPELSDAELRAFGERGHSQGFRQIVGSHDDAIQFTRSQTQSLVEYEPGKLVGYNSRGVEFRVFPKIKTNYTSIRINGVEGLKGIKFMWP